MIRANELNACYIRPLVLRGYGEMGVNPLQAPVNVVIAVWPWGAYLGEDALEEGVRIKISSWRRNSQNSLPAAAKATGQYINSVLAKVESLKAGYDEAIMLNEAGFVTDGSGENVFVVRDGVLTTRRSRPGAWTASRGAPRSRSLAISATRSTRRTSSARISTTPMMLLHGYGRGAHADP